MAMDNKQKTMLGVLAVLVLGMGGYWYAMMGDNRDPRGAESQGSKLKRKRGSVAHADKKPKTHRRKTERSVSSVPRRERKAADRNPGHKRIRDTRRVEAKKKIPTPAS